MRTVVMVAWRARAWFEVDFGHSHAIFHKKNLVAAARESCFTAFFRPMGRRLPQFFILHQLDRHIAEGLIREIPGYVSKVSRREPRFAIRELEVHRRLALDFVGD